MYVTTFTLKLFYIIIIFIINFDFKNKSLNVVNIFLKHF